MQFVDKQPRRAARTPLVVLVVLNIMLLIAVATLLLAQATPTAEPRVVTPRGELGADERATIELFRNARESVVFISTRQHVTNFWTRNVYSVPRGSGSGLVWDAAGHIVTNFHVIEGASEAQIQLADGRQFSASLVGASPQHDLAVLKIGGAGFVAPARVPIGSSGDLQVGQNVFAIGNPFGLDWTLTKGIVSALDRSLPNEDGPDIRHLVQTDAAINPGNSGGALFNMQGQVIGINSSKIASTEYEGMGFAVPSSTAVDTANSLIKNGYVAGRAKIGVTYNTITSYNNADAILSALTEKGFKNAKGTMVINQVSSDSDLAGKQVKQYDMIVAVNGKTMTSTDVMTQVLSDSKPGDTIKLTIARIENNQIKTFKVDCKLIESKGN